MTSGSKLGTHEHKINYPIYPIIFSYSTLSALCQRKDQIIDNQLRIGHTRLTHTDLILLNTHILQNVQTVINFPLTSAY